MPLFLIFSIFCNKNCEVNDKSQWIFSTLMFIWFKNIVLCMILCRCQHHQYRIGGKVIHRVPIFRFEDEAFVRFIQHILILLTIVVAMNLATTLNTDSRLHSRMMPMSSTNRIIHTIDIEDTFDIKRYHFLYHCQISTLIRVCCQINQSFSLWLCMRSYLGINLHLKTIKNILQFSYILLVL